MVSIVSYSLTIPNLGSRCANIPAQYPMLVSTPPSHKRTAQKWGHPGGAILTPRFQAKICSGCHGLTIETRLTIEHVYQCAAFQSLVACASGWEAMAQGNNRCSCKKNERIFLCQTDPQVNFLVRFGFTTKWIFWNWSRKVVFDFSNCSGALGAYF